MGDIYINCYTFLRVTEKLCKYILDALLSKANSTFINRCRFKKIICSETLLTCLLLNLQGNFAHILNTTLIMIYIPTLFKYCKSPLGIQKTLYKFELLMTRKI